MFAPMYFNKTALFERKYLIITENLISAINHAWKITVFKQTRYGAAMCAALTLAGLDADPVLAAIECLNGAWAVIQVAPPAASVRPRGLTPRWRHTSAPLAPLGQELPA
jgi:hypothetical protein